MMKNNKISNEEMETILRNISMMQVCDDDTTRYNTLNNLVKCTLSIKSLNHFYFREAVINSILVLDINEYDLAFIFENIPLELGKTIINRMYSIIYTDYRNNKNFKHMKNDMFILFDRFIRNANCKRKSLMKFILTKILGLKLEYIDIYIKYDVMSKEYLELDHHQQVQYMMCLNQIINKNICHDRALYKNITMYFNMLNKVSDKDLLLFRIIVRDILKGNFYLSNVFSEFHYDSFITTKFTLPESEQYKLLDVLIEEFSNMHVITIKTVLKWWITRVEKYGDSGIYWYRAGSGLFSNDINVYDYTMKKLNTIKRMKPILLEMKLGNNN